MGFFFIFRLLNSDYRDRWLDSLIFNDETGAYKSWTLFLISVAILTLIGGVVLLTHKKPEPVASKVKSSTASRPKRKPKPTKRANANGISGQDDEESLVLDEDDDERTIGEHEALYAVGDASEDDDTGEDDDIDHHQNPINLSPTGSRRGTIVPRRGPRAGVNEQTGLVEADDGDGRDRRRRSMDPFGDPDEEEMGEFERGASRVRR